MPTVPELRVQAKRCLELADRTSDLDAKNALRELAQGLIDRHAKLSVVSEIAARSLTAVFIWLGDSKLGSRRTPPTNKS